MAGARSRLAGLFNQAAAHAPAEERRTWYRITKNADAPNLPGPGEEADPNKAVIDIYGEIGFWGVEAAQFSSELRNLAADEIELHLNSPGGEIYDGIAIYNALVNHPARIDVRIDGLAASIASVIAQAGDSITIMPNAQMMIHDAWGLTVGNAEEHLKAVEELNRHSDNIANVYAVRSGRGTTNSWRKLMKAETWYTAKEAVDAGLADQVAPQGKRGNSADPIATWRDELAGFKYLGREQAPAPELLPPPTAAPSTNNTSASYTANIVWTTDGAVMTSASGNGVSFGNASTETVVLPAGATTEPAPEPVVLDPGLIFAALVRHETADQPAVASEVVTAGVAAAAAAISATFPQRDATATSYEPPAPEPYRPETLPPITTAEHIIAATQAAAAIPAEGGPVAVPGSSYDPPAPEPYIAPVAPPVTSAEQVLASTQAAAAGLSAQGDPLPTPIATYEPPAPEPYVAKPATPISSAEWVLAATSAAAQAPPPAAQDQADHDLSAEAQEHIRRGFLEVLLP